MRKRIIISIVIFSALLICVEVYKSYCNHVIFAAMLEDNDSPIFNQKKELKYEYLSSHMKKYINRDKFENITSWEQAAKVFNGITESDRKPFRIDYFHSFKEFYYKKKYYMVSYDVSFIKTLFGCRVDKIKIEVGPHPCK